MLMLTCSLHTRPCTRSRYPELRLSWCRVARCSCAPTKQTIVLPASHVCVCDACAVERNSLLRDIASTPLDNASEVRESINNIERARRMATDTHGVALWAEDFAWNPLAARYAHDARRQRAQERVPALETVVRLAAERASVRAMPRVLQKCATMRELIARQNTLCDAEVVLTAALVGKGLPQSDAANWLHFSNSHALQ